MYGKADILSCTYFKRENCIQLMMNKKSKQGFNKFRIQCGGCHWFLSLQWQLWFMLFILQNNKSVTTAESRVFWLGLVICPLIWMFFLIAALFSLKFKWLVSCIDLWRQPSISTQTTVAAELALGSPPFNSPGALLHGQLVGFLPVGIFNRLSLFPWFVSLRSWKALLGSGQFSTQIPYILLLILLVLTILV